MGRRARDLTLDDLEAVPREPMETLFWEIEADELPVDPRFQKEEWISSTLLEWGCCGKVLIDEDDGAVGFAQYAPPQLFPRLGRYRCGRVSPDAVYLAYCYVAPGHRGRGAGTELVRAVARDLVDRGHRALEALGERDWSGGWVLPSRFLEANRFSVVRDDRRTPLLRLDLRQRGLPRRDRVAAALPATG